MPDVFLPCLNKDDDDNIGAPHSGGHDRFPCANPGGGGVRLIMAYTGRLRPGRVPFSGLRYMKG